jgi:hypothetical protein
VQTFSCIFQLLFHWIKFRLMKHIVYIKSRIEKIGEWVEWMWLKSGDNSIQFFVVLFVLWNDDNNYNWTRTKRFIMNWNELESMIQICTRHILFACVLKRNGKKKKLTHFVFRFVIWERFVVDYYCLGLSIHILSTIDDIFVKNQKESKRMRKVSWNWKMKVWLVSFVDWLIEKQQTNNEWIE